MDFKSAFKEVFKKLPFAPVIGSIWAAPNRIWDNDFAWNKKSDDFHPAIVAEIKACNTIITILPGTTSNHDGEICAYKVDLQYNNKTSYFLFALAMPYTKEKLLDLDRGWNGINELNKNQLTNFKSKIKICL